MSGEVTDGAGADGPGISARFQFSIKTFTGRYLPVEDRLRLDGVDVEGVEQCILLTRRLCNKLVPTIATQLEENFPEGMPRDVAQDMRQSSARQVRSATATESPVVPGSASPTWLCVTVHIKKFPNGEFLVVFTDDRSIDASMGMTEVNFRAVLDVLHELYEKAEWSSECFPDWFERPGPVEPSQLRLN